MLLRHRFRKALHSRPGSPGRAAGPMTRASDVILVMMAGFLVILAAIRIFHG